MNKTILGTGVFFGLLAIILGAFGAHMLRGTIPDSALEAFKTGVDYQMYHALLLLILGGTNLLAEGGRKWVFRLLLCGILCFSFSLYLLAADTLLPFDASRIGFLTPIGGLLFLSGWMLMAYRIYKPLN
jgi:uncharacterized membrane protein YgdD (TMEM256/DUF423 family)